MLWEKIKERLQDTIPETAHKLWIEPLTCTSSENLLLELSCPDRFFCAWVSENYLARIKGVLDALGESDVTVRFSVANDYPCLPGRKDEQLRLPAMPEARSYVKNLHPRYTFDEFMVGDCNQLAQSACQAISQGDTTLGPSLYINAGTGLGKSHLTHAVAHNIINLSAGTRLHYLTAQQFSAEMVRRIRTNSMDKFKDKYHNHCDVLLLEDVHSLAGKTKTQVELNEILDVLIKAGKRIILTGASAPRDLKGIDDGFRSRMAAGLLSTINPPGLQTRRLIIQRKARNCNLDLDEDLIEYMARKIRGDIRQVESAIVGLKAKSSLLKMSPDINMVREVVDEIVGSSLDLTVESIRDFMASQYKVSVSDLKSKSRKKAIAFPRQISMYLARKFTEQGLAEIGKAFNRDHSTVLHSVRVITAAMARSGSVHGQIEFLARKLQK